MLILNEGFFLGKILDTAVADGVHVGRVSYDKNGSCDEMHCHENPHISFVLKGGNIEKRKNVEFERLPGRVTFYHSGEAHQNIYQHAGSSHINIEMTPSYLKVNTLDIDTIHERCRSSPHIKSLILKVYKELLIDDDLSGYSIPLLLLELFSHDKQLPASRPLWVNILEEMLHDRWNELLSLRDLSDAVGVHPVTISKHFSKYFNCTLGEYVRKLRINKAIALIKSSDNSLTGIAFQCGFADQSHFIRTFKQMTGFLPRQFQRL